MRDRLIIALVALLVFGGCYSFTGASIPPHIHTIGIPLAEDNSGFGQSDVRQTLTDLLVQKFTTDGSLRVTNRSNSDAVLETSISSIVDEPVTVRQGEEVSTKRVRITIHGIYRDQKKQKLFWERDFAQSSDYLINQNLTGQRTALRQAVDKAAEDMLVSVISNW
jgi:hypothetical protein